MGDVVFTRIRPLICDVVPLDEAVRIFDTLRDHPRQLLGTVIVVAERPPIFFAVLASWRFKSFFSRVG